uniref:Uncharacterized protein n=1 Tax=Anguilla anguilla TaxID=7936 RepID=A0A0E9R7N6_ANGAN
MSQGCVFFTMRSSRYRAKSSLIPTNLSFNSISAQWPNWEHDMSVLCS